MKNRDDFRMRHPLEGLEPEEQEKEINLLKTEFILKMSENYVKTTFSLEDKTPEEKYDILKNTLEPSIFGRKYKLQLKRKEVWRRSYLPLFLLVGVLGYYFLSGTNLKNASNLELDLLIGVIVIWIVLSGISLSKTYKLY